MQNELAGFASLLKEGEARSRELEVELAERGKQHETRETSLTQALDEAQKSKEQLQAQLEDMRGTLEEVSAELTDRKERLAKQEDELRETKAAEARIEELSGLIGVSEKEIASREAKFQRVQSQNQELLTRVDGLQPLKLDLTKATNEQERLKTALEVRDLEVRKSQEEVTQAKQELSKA